jgi:hypothetical protein
MRAEVVGAGALTCISGVRYALCDRFDGAVNLALDRGQAGLAMPHHGRKATDLL